MNQIYKIYFLTLSVLLSLQLICSAQHKSILLLDKISNEPIEFAYVYSESFNTLSDSVGVVLLDLKEHSENIHISHINYRKETVNSKDIANIDTLFLSPVIFVLNEISVAAPKQKIDLYKRINNILKKYQNSRSKESLQFTYLLKTIIAGTIVEKITSCIKLNYHVGDMNIFPDIWLNNGVFNFKEDAPFINLDLEQLIFKMHPFHETQGYNLLTSKKISRKDHSIRFLECASCDINQIKLVVKSESQTCILLIDVDKEKLLNAIYKIDSSATLAFLKITDDRKYKFKELTLQYEFNEVGVPIVINGDLSLTYLDKLVNSKFIFYRTEYPYQNQSFLVLGNPPFNNIYEQMIFQPSIDFIPADTSSFFVDTTMLARFDESFRKKFIESGITGKKLIYLNQPVDSLPIDILFVDDDFYIDRFGVFTNYQSDLKIYQSFSIIKNGVTDTLLSIYPVLDLSNSRIYSKFNDPYYTQWALMLISYLYEVGRQSLVKELNNTKYLGLDSLVRVAQVDFNNSRIQNNELLNGFLLKDNQLLTMVKLNNTIDSIIGFNVFDHLMRNNYGCRECKEKLISEISKIGFKLKRSGEHNPDAYLCFWTALSGMKYLINEVEQENLPDKRMIGGYYSILAGFYIELNNLNDACQCLEKFKLLFNEGFNLLLSKKEYYYNNCVK